MNRRDNMTPTDSCDENTEGSTTDLREQDDVLERRFSFQLNPFLL